MVGGRRWEWSGALLKNWIRQLPASASVRRFLYTSVVGQATCCYSITKTFVHLCYLTRNDCSRCLRDQKAPKRPASWWGTPASCTYRIRPILMADPDAARMFSRVCCARLPAELRQTSRRARAVFGFRSVCRRRSHAQGTSRLAPSLLRLLQLPSLFPCLFSATAFWQARALSGWRELLEPLHPSERLPPARHLPIATHWPRGWLGLGVAK